jgi:glycosyltransferase involved in cell wall biosynthesis
VICIFLNEERYLTEAIESVLAQTFGDFELLLVDDGSSDESPAIARGYAARFPEKIFYLDHPGHENRGMSASRNLGIERARGEYLAFFDGDDRWYPNKLSEQVAVLDANPAVGLVCGGYNEWRSWDGGNDLLFLSGPVSDRPVLPPELTLQVYPLGWSNSPADPMVRRALAERVGGYEEAFAGLYEDHVFLSKINLEAGAVFLSSTSLDYRQHAESCTGRATWDDYIETRRKFLDWFESYIADRPVPGKARIEKRIRQERRKLRSRFRVRASRRARNTWLKAIRLLGFSDHYRRHSASA